MRMNLFRRAAVAATLGWTAFGWATPACLFGANHREAPITALDHKADITDIYAFRSYDGGATPRVTLILCVDPLLDPANGPNWFPFDPEILYEIKVDNNNDAVADVTFQFRFNTEQRLQNLFQVYAGAGNGISAPANSPAPVPPGTLIVPPQINSFSSSGLCMRQSYSVTMVKSGIATNIAGSGPFYAVPANVGPRTMDYAALFSAGTYARTTQNVNVFTGTTDDAFWIDLGGAFDTLNLHISPVLSAAQDSPTQNFASDTVSGYGVNSIAIEVPVSMLTRTGNVEPPNSPAATIGVWGTTSRPRVTVRQSPLPQQGSGGFRQVLKESLRLAPDNFEARRIETWIALGKHEFSRALELARALSKSRSDDVLAYALLTDACVETGNYDEAEKAAQWALDMRPGEVSGLTRAAYLRELFGDIQGSVDLMQSAYNKTAPSEVEDRAWILTQFAHLQLLSGKPEVAELALADALKLFPDYHYALGYMVKVRIAQKRYDDAVTVAKVFIKAAPHPENLFVLGDALARAGKSDEAKSVFEDFEVKALAESEGTDNANRELVFYYVNHADKPADALRIAKSELARRQDIFTREAYAWSLQANGEFKEARDEIEKALAIGMRDPLFFYHAGIIAQKNGDHEQAAKYLQESLKQAERSEVCDLATTALDVSRAITIKQ